MAYWSHRRVLDDAWKCYLTTIDADFYLFQEGRPAQAVQRDAHFVWEEIGDARDWGSGIYSPAHEVVDEDIGSSFKGALTIGNTNVRGTALTLISLYGLMESTGPTKGYSIPNVHRMFSDLTALLNGHIGGRRNIILGGDLNASTQLDPRQGNCSHELFFARIADFGLESAHTLSGNEEHIQTLRHRNSKVPWHNDYMFLSAGMASRLRGYQVIDTEEVRQFSDHNIVVIDIELLL
jgi:exodeoxyribonuclease-3